VDDEPAEHRALVALSKVGIALRSEAWRDAGPRGLNPTQAQILVALTRAPGTMLRPKALAEQLAVSLPTVSDSLKALERKGLLARHADPSDGRAVVVTLTRDGRSQAGEIAEWPDIMLSAVDVLSDEEKGVLLRTLLKVIRELQERGRIAPARMCVTCDYFRPYAHEDPRRPHHCAFADAPFGDPSLRVDCADHEPAAPEAAAAVWEALTRRVPPGTPGRVR